MPALCWTDHAHLIADVTAPRASPLTIRWLADLEGRGDRLVNLSGKACGLADGQSRKHPEHLALLRREATKLRSLTLEAILDSDRGSSDEEVWGADLGHRPAAEALRQEDHSCRFPFRSGGRWVDRRRASRSRCRRRP